jgi:hypothetical protein
MAISNAFGPPAGPVKALDRLKELKNDEIVRPDVAGKGAAQRIGRHLSGGQVNPAVTNCREKSAADKRVGPECELRDQASAAELSGCVDLLVTQETYGCKGNAEGESVVDFTLDTS